MFVRCIRCYCSSHLEVSNICELTILPSDGFRYEASIFTGLYKLGCVRTYVTFDGQDITLPGMNYGILKGEVLRQCSKNRMCSNYGVIVATCYSNMVVYSRCTIERDTR